MLKAFALILVTHNVDGAENAITMAENLTFEECDAIAFHLENIAMDESVQFYCEDKENW